MAIGVSVPPAAGESGELMAMRGAVDDRLLTNRPVESARNARTGWARTAPADRAAVLVADVQVAADELTAAQHKRTGKPHDDYGLAATVLTADMARARRAWRELPVGTVKVNAVFGGAPGGSAQPRAASGEGFGYGPELPDEMTVTKVVHIALPEVRHA